MECGGGFCRLQKIFTVNEFFLSLSFKFGHEVCIIINISKSKTNKDKSTEICPPLLLKIPYTVYAHVQCQEAKKVGKKGRRKRSAKKVGKKGRQKRAAKGGNVKEDDSALALQYMSFYSTVWNQPIPTDKSKFCLLLDKHEQYCTEVVKEFL